MKQMILKINDDVSELPPELNISWLNTRMVGTRSYYNHVIILILSPIGILELEDKFAELELNWSVIAVEDEPINQSEILRFIEDIPVFDEDGEKIGTEDVTDITGKLQTISGHSWTYD